MDRLQGYNTDGHEYRISEIDRNNTRRLKWMIGKAKKQVEARNSTKKTSDSSINGIASLSGNINTKKINNTSLKNKIFQPGSINQFKCVNSNNNPFNQK